MLIHSIFLVIYNKIEFLAQFLSLKFVVSALKKNITSSL